MAFGSPQITCWDKSIVWLSCGSLFVSNGSTTPRVGPSGQRWDSSTLRTAPLKNNDFYHGAHNTYFTPDGYPRYTATTLNTGDFFCAAGANCRF